MDFAWTSEQLELHKHIVDFARANLNAGLVQRDREGEFSRDSWQKLAGLGVHGLAMPTDFGGLAQGALGTVGALEALGYGCRDGGLLFAVTAQMFAVQAPLARFGSNEQKQRYLPKLIQGEWIGAHAMTEPNSGSDSFALATTATLDGNDYVLNGSKTFATNAPLADTVLVFASVNRERGFFGVTAFLVDRDTPGMELGKPIAMMGLRTTQMGEIAFNDCRIPVSARLGREGNGGSIFKYSMGWERASILATAVGTMQRQLEVCVEYAKTRQQFGQPIGKFQAVANRIADMSVRLEAARMLLYKWAWKRDRGEDAEHDAAAAKLFLSECFVQSSLDAILVHGGYGYSAEYEIERELRDAVASKIYSGTSDIQHALVARGLGLG
jgi:alkylation response protein AidB-like acyl-CoA dehydrogenase